MKKTHAKLTAILSATALFFVLFSANASAHVTVSPSSSAPGSWETYSIKIPSEKDLPTTKVALKVPEGFDFKQYRPVPDWEVELTKDEAGRITTVSWSAEKDGIGPGEFQKFEFVGKNPDREANLAWDAFQYYSDGSIVEWTGEADSDKPHSITVITNDPEAGTTLTPGHDHHDTASDSGSQSNALDTGSKDTSSAAAPDKAKTTATAEQPSGRIATVIASVALILSAAALILAIRKSKR
ncbi:YcnI family copper-binding membrane protein [Paenibacillus aceti]|uniref:YncI copper-binding domain-containing protein n=1 Tax=Paenibacillus aceti TaxID=1820010 RepID=A0ABQ1VZ07_9BACL|nr:YcnI family protein [Paenibacillus aceti]GGG04537.1 hypothetical protein GCM10010913_27940 [Paenibacillus aceti]